MLAPSPSGRATVNAARHYEKLDDGINEEGLIELHKEVWALYQSIEALVEELSGGHFDSVAANHRGSMKSVRSPVRSSHLRTSRASNAAPLSD